MGTSNLQAWEEHDVVGATACVSTRDGSVITVGAFVTLKMEEHTSELQSHSDLVCRLLLEKKKKPRKKRIKKKN